MKTKPFAAHALRSAGAGLRALALVCLGLGLWAAPAHAGPWVSQEELPALTQRWVDQTLAQQSARTGQPLRLRASVGELNSRLRLADCARVEPYLPAGSRLWGKTRVGLRCLQGATRWNVFLPVTVTASGQAWVVRRDVRPGEALQEGDLMLAEVDWAAEPGEALAATDAWLGQVATRQLNMGQTVRESMLRAPQVFQPGAQVRVLVQGRGFQISATGQAVSPGVVGQAARVRMESGRVMSVTVLDARTVSMAI